MKNEEEKLVERRVTYTLEHEGKFYIVAQHSTVSLDSEGDELEPGASFDCATEEAFDTRTEAEKYLAEFCVR